MCSDPNNGAYGCAQCTGEMEASKLIVSSLQKVVVVDENGSCRSLPCHPQGCHPVLHSTACKVAEQEMDVGGVGCIHVTAIHKVAAACSTDMGKATST